MTKSDELARNTKSVGTLLKQLVDDIDAKIKHTAGSIPDPDIISLEDLLDEKMSLLLQHAERQHLPVW